MQQIYRKAVLAGVLALVGAVCADIPGLFVVQEARIGDPLPIAGANRSSFGEAAIANIGDLDGDGVNDLIVGTPHTRQDSGGLLILPLVASGKLKASEFQISPSDPKISPLLETGLYHDQLGWGIAVIRAFSPTEPCAVVMTNSGVKRKLWLLNICRDQANVPYVASAFAFDTSSVGLSGIGINGGVMIGYSMAVLDTLPSGERLVGVGIQQDGKTSSSFEGRVVLLAVDPATDKIRRIGVFPPSYDPSDPVASHLVPGEWFGQSLGPTRGVRGRKGMAVLSSKYKVSGNVVGRIHLITFDENYGLASDTTILGTDASSPSGGAISLSTADFDHDGISDLVLGYNLDNAGGLAPANLGAVRVVLLAADGSQKASQIIRKGMRGFADSTFNDTIDCRLGTRVLSTDFNGDNQVDILASSRGTVVNTTPDIPGSIFPLRMKTIPWLHKPGDTLKLSTAVNSVHLSDYVTGNGLTWTISEVNPPSTGSIATCSISGPDLSCTPFTTNGYANWKLVASDTGNIPATEHFTQELDFVVQVSGVNLPPVHGNPLPPKVSLHEDQADTAALILSSYFNDPEGARLIFGLTPLNGSTTNLLLSYMTASSPFDTLHLQPFPLHHGLCSLQVSIKDDKGATILDTLVVEVVHVNHPPQAVDDAYIITESTPTSFDVKKNDKDADVTDVLTITIATSPKHGRADTVSQQIFYRPDSFYLGNDSLQYKLSDGAASALAWVRVAIGATTEPLRIYKALRDTSVLENDSANPTPIVIRTDSLFFWGPLRFNVTVFEATSDCQSIAKIAHDRTNHLLAITPLRYQWGKCSVSIKEDEQNSLSSTMNVSISSVLTPYKFGKDTLLLQLKPGQTTVVPLDSVDLDKDTLAYSTVKALPSWIQLSNFGLTFTPDGSSLDTKILLVVRKKALPGVTFTDSTDVLTVTAQVDPASIRLRGRQIGGASLSESQERLTISGGDSPFRIEVLSLSGQHLASASAPGMGQVSFETQSYPHLLVLRLTEGSHVTSVPLFLHH